VDGHDVPKLDGGFGWRTEAAAVRPPRGSLLLMTDPEGVIVKAKSSTDMFHDGESLVGCDVGVIYANDRAPHLIHDMLASGSGLEEFRQLAETEWGIIGVHRLRNGRLTFDAVVKCEGGLAVGTVVGRKMLDRGGRHLGFTQMITDVTEKYPLEKSIKRVLSPGERSGGADTARLRRVGRLLVNTYRHGAAILDGGMKVVASNVLFNIREIGRKSLAEGVEAALRSGKPVHMASSRPAAGPSGVLIVPLDVERVIVLVKE